MASVPPTLPAAPERASREPRCAGRPRPLGEGGCRSGRGGSGDPAGVPRWRLRWRRNPRHRQAAKTGPARLETDGPGRGPANGRPPPLRAPRPGLGRVAAAPGMLVLGRASPFSTGRRRTRPWLPGHGAEGAQSVSAGGEWRRADREARGRPGGPRAGVPWSLRPFPQTGCGTPPTCPDPRFGPLGRPAHLAAPS